MRSILLLALAAALATPAGAQSPIPLEGVGERAGPNARAAQRPLGPNAQAARRGPARSDARTTLPGERPGEPAAYPNCAAVRAVRAVPLHRGEPGYGRHLDRDGDGRACG